MFNEMKDTARYKRWSDGIGSVVVLVSASAILGLLRFTQRSIAADGSAAALLLPSVPTLQLSPFGRARRFSFWFLALFFHTVNALLYVLKDEADYWSLLIKSSSSVITLVFCIGFLILLGKSFPITQDFWIAGGIFSVFYVVIVMVSMIPSLPAIVLGLVHILITLYEYFALQLSGLEGFLQFEIIPFSVYILGIISASLPFFPCYDLSAYKIAGAIGGLFRFVDAIFILGAWRDKINHFLVRLQEILI